jgi:hypothetical protein
MFTTKVEFLNGSADRGKLRLLITNLSKPMCVLLPNEILDRLVTNRIGNPAQEYDDQELPPTPRYGYW